MLFVIAGGEHRPGELTIDPKKHVQFIRNPTEGPAKARLSFREVVWDLCEHHTVSRELRASQIVGILPTIDTGHLWSGLNHKILDAALLRLRFYSISQAKSEHLFVTRISFQALTEAGGEAG